MPGRRRSSFSEAAEALTRAEARPGPGCGADRGRSGLRGRSCPPCAPRYSRRESARRRSGRSLLQGTTSSRASSRYSRPSRRNPRTFLLLHPSGPLDTARAGMVAADVAPALQAEVDELRENPRRTRRTRRYSGGCGRNNRARARRDRTGANGAHSGDPLTRTDLPERGLRRTTRRCSP